MSGIYRLEEVGAGSIFKLVKQTWSGGEGCLGAVL